jgi:hypothetical protein
LEERIRDLRRIEERERKLQQELQACRVKEKTAKKNHEQSEALINWLRNAERYVFSREIAAMAWKEVDSLSDVMTLGDRRADFLQKHWDSVWSKWRRSDPVRELVRHGIERPPDMPARSDKEFVEQWKCCGQCAKGKMKQHVLRRSSLESCLDKQEQAWTLSQDRIVKRMERERSLWAATVRRRLKGDLAERKARLGQLTEAAAASEQAVDEIAQNRDHREREIEEFQKGVTRAERNLAKLRGMLDAGLRAEFDDRNRVAERAKGDEERLAEVMAALLAVEEFARIEKVGT